MLNPVQEAKSPFIDLGDEDDPVHIRAMLLYIYDLDYGTDTAHYDKAEELLFLAGLFGVGDKYDIPELRLECVTKFEEAARQRGGCISDLAFFDAMTHVLSRVYADKTLRHKTLEVCCGELEDCVRAVGFDKVLDQVPGLAKWLLLDTFRTMDPTMLMQCTVCGAVVEHARSLCPRCYVSAEKWVGLVWKKDDAGSDIPDHDIDRNW